MKVLVAFKGATAWEAQFGPIMLRWPFRQYLKVGDLPSVRWDLNWIPSVGGALLVVAAIVILILAAFPPPPFS